MQIVVILFVAVLSLMESVVGKRDDCLPKRKVGAVIGNILKKRKEMTITLNPDELEYLVSLKHGCTEADVSPKSIYFSAALKGAYTTKAKDEVIKFRDVIMNEGGAYNSTNGNFVCPRTGLYLINFGFLSYQVKGIHCQLYINGKPLVFSYTPGDAKFNSAERSLPIPLKKGDVVNVRVSESGSSLYGGRYSTFSAVYIQV